MGFIILLAIFTTTSCKLEQKTVQNNRSETDDNRNMQHEYFDRNYTLYQIDSNKFLGQDSLVTTHYSNGEIQTSGNYARNRNGDVSTLKIGVVKKYYETGQLKEKGKYDIGRYTQCCAGGLCSQFYNYKLGKWTYFFPNGSVKAKVSYLVNILQIETNCVGGDHVNFGKINIRDSEFWNEAGVIIEPPIELVNELETVVYNQESYHRESLSIQDGKVMVRLVVDEK